LFPQQARASRYHGLSLSAQSQDDSGRRRDVVRPANRSISRIRDQNLIPFSARPIVIIRKLCATRTASHPLGTALLGLLVPAIGLSLPTPLTPVTWGQDSPQAESPPAEDAAKDSPETAAPEAGPEADAESPKAEEAADQASADDTAAEPTQVAAAPAEVPKPIDAEGAELQYPRAIALEGERLFVVDLDLPGIWVREGETLKLHTPGTKLLRKPMNRPWCVVPHPQQGILIGDSATREIYHSAEPNGSLTALNGGYLGIPMALAVAPDGQTIYVGDAERRAVFRLPIGGGQPELVARVNARGLSFDSEGQLWAVTPDAEAVYRIDVEQGQAEAVIDGRPYQFPNGLVWSQGEGFVTDGYGKAIWRFTADGKTEKWFEGDPLKGPVGITADEDYLYVADPQNQQVFRFDRKSKAVEPLL
jgi:sugar lactone lactonase YvrE